MKSFVIATALTVILGACAAAQSPPTGIPATSPPVVGLPVYSAAPVYSPYGYITNGYFKSGGVFVGGTGSLPFDSGYYLLGGTDGLARVAGSYRLVVQPGATGSVPCPTCAGPASAYPR